MTRTDSPLLATRIFPFLEKDGDAEWWSEKRERGEMEEVKEEEERKKKTEEDRAMEIHCKREKTRRKKRRGEAACLSPLSFFLHDEIFPLKERDRDCGREGE